MSPYLVQARGHDQEGGRSLMAPVRDTGTILIRIENVVPFRSTLVETEIFPSYPGYLEGVAHCLARSLQLFRVAHQTRHGVVHGDLERVRFDYYTFSYEFETRGLMIYPRLEIFIGIYPIRLENKQYNWNSCNRIPLIPLVQAMTPRSRIIQVRISRFNRILTKISFETNSVSIYPSN